jgi:hypothetical protein
VEPHHRAETAPLEPADEEFVEMGGRHFAAEEAADVGGPPGMPSKKVLAYMRGYTLPNKQAEIRKAGFSVPLTSSRASGTINSS